MVIHLGWARFAFGVLMMSFSFGCVSLPDHGNANGFAEHAFEDSLRIPGTVYLLHSCSVCLP